MTRNLKLALRKVRIILNRSEWMIRLLGLSRASGSKTGKGLVLIQIDGFSHADFLNASARGYIPFLSRLEEREHYHPWQFYSGLPSNTPSVQGELFYGVRQCVCAFQFQDHITGNVFTMYQAEAAAEIESRLKQKAPGLCEGGSSYGNIFSGGAEESHFNASTFGFRGFFKAIHPKTLTVILLFHFHIIIRAVVLVMIEIFLAFYDFCRGILKGDLLAELFFIPTRVLVSILLREVITAQAKIDIARGLPIIHINLFGYDEQAHRRGPSSKFAYWSLRGIDSAIKRIWYAAQRATLCYYDVWIYSDHGQIKTTPYPHLQGKSLKQAVNELAQELLEKSPAPIFPSRGEIKKELPYSYLKCSQGRQERTKRRGDATAELEKKNEILTTFLGPVAQVYFNQMLTDNQKEIFAKGLVERIDVPLVMATDSRGRVFCWTKTARYILPHDAAHILGPNHPYLREATEDLLHLSAHPDRGDFTLFGWCEGSRGLSFPLECGAHGGFAPGEVTGFCLLPADTLLVSKDKVYLRPRDLRNSALGFLDRLPVKISYPVLIPKHKPGKIRIMTYNVHSCIGMDGRLSVERIARVIARYDPDIVCLQELDAGRMKSGSLNQAEVIAEKLEMAFNFHPVYGSHKQEFGNAILSAYPMQLIAAQRLPGFMSKHILEPRGALWVEADIYGQKIQVMNTHLSLWWGERGWQVEALLGSDWLNHRHCLENPVILCGDFNVTPLSSALRRLCSRLTHIQKNQHKSTWPSRLPWRCLDHILISSHLQVTQLGIPTSELERIASDHLPVIAEINFSHISFKQKESLKNLDSPILKIINFSETNQP